MYSPCSVASRKISGALFSLELSISCARRSSSEKTGISTASAMCVGGEQPVSVSKEILWWIGLDTAGIAKTGLEERRE